MLYEITIGLLVLVLIGSLSAMHVLHRRRLNRERAVMYEWLVGAPVKAVTQIESSVRMDTPDGRDLYVRRLVPEGMKGKIVYAWYCEPVNNWVVKICWQDHFALGDTLLSSVRLVLQDEEALVGQ